MKKRIKKCLLMMGFSFCLSLTQFDAITPLKADALIDTHVRNEDFTNPTFSDITQFQLWKKRVDSKNNIPKNFTNVNNEKFNLVQDIIIDLGTEYRSFGWLGNDHTFLHRYGVMYTYKMPENLPVDISAGAFSSYEPYVQVSLTRQAGLEVFMEADHKIGAGFANNAVGGAHSLQAAVGVSIGYEISINYKYTDVFKSDLYAFDPFPVYNFHKVLIGIIEEKVYFTRNFFGVEENPTYESNLKGAVLTLPYAVTFKCGSSFPLY